MNSAKTIQPDTSPGAARLDPRVDGWPLVLGFTIVAGLVGMAIETNYGQYDIAGLALIAIALAVGMLAIVWKPARITSRIARLAVYISLSAAINIQATAILSDYRDDDWIIVGTLIIAFAAFACFFDSRWVKPAVVGTMLLAFLGTGIHVIRAHGDLKIDVLMFQQDGSRELLRGKNPYAMRFPNVYPKDRGFYGPGVVDEHNMLTIGFPYPPASLLMVVPSVKAFGDCRYSDLAALLISAGLMAFVMPGRLGALVAGLFLLSPTSFFVLGLSWTESLLLLTFSITMFCAYRWRAGLPYALGLFFATKQSSVLALPAVFLLASGSRAWREVSVFLLKAGIVAAVITIPFILWNPHEFWHVVVQWQFVQPFRADALSFMVWLRKNDLLPWLFTGPERRPSMMIAFALAGVAAVLCLWRCPRTPSGFAACVCLVNVVFFAYSKQAFCNYYFFAVGAACWAVAAGRPYDRMAGLETGRNRAPSGAL